MLLYAQGSMSRDQILTALEGQVTAARQQITEKLVSPMSTPIHVQLSPHGMC